MKKLCGNQLVPVRAENLWRYVTAAFLACLLASATRSVADEPDARRAVRSSWQEVTAWLDRNTERNGDLDRFVQRDQVVAMLNSQVPDWFTVQRLNRALGEAAGDLDLDAFRTFRYAWHHWLAQLPIPNSAELAVLATSVAQREPTVSKEACDAARKRLEEDLARLENRLRRGGGTQGWIDYLKLSQLREAVQSEQALRSPETSLDPLRERFRLGALTWPSEDLVQTSKSLEAFSVQARVYGDPDFRAQRRSKLERLAQLLSEWTTDQEGLPSSEVMEICDWLRERNAGGSLVAGIHRRFVHPNFVLHVSNQALAPHLNRELNESFPINDVFAGTRVRGNGRLTGTIEANFVPSVGQGILEFSLTGKTVASTTGHSNDATIRSTGRTDLKGVKRVVIDIGGVRGTPARATANTTISYDAVNTSRRIGRQQVLSRVYASRSQAERDSERAAVSSIGSRLDESIDPWASSMDQWWQENMVNPLVSRLTWPETHTLQSGPDGLTVALLYRQPAQFGAAAPPPRTSDGIQMMIDASFLERMSARRVQGKTIQGADVHRALNSPQDASPAEDPADAWSVTFDSLQPISVAFRDDSIDLDLRLTGFRSDDRDRMGLAVSGRYQFVLRDGRLWMQREGEFQIEPLDFVRGQNRLSGPQLVTRQILRRKLEENIPHEIDVISLLDQEDGSCWACDSYSIQDGWLTLNIDLVATEVQAIGPR